MCEGGGGGRVCECEGVVGCNIWLTCVGESKGHFFPEVNQRPLHSCRFKSQKEVEKEGKLSMQNHSSVAYIECCIHRVFIASPALHTPHVCVSLCVCLFHCWRIMRAGNRILSFPLPASSPTSHRHRQLAILGRRTQPALHSILPT